MNLQSKYVDIVNQIPVDQTARATPIIKNFLLKQVNRIIERKKVLESSARDKRKKEVLEAYKKSVGFDKKAKRLIKLEEEVDQIRKDLISLGLTSDGTLMEIRDMNPYGISSEKGMWVYSSQSGGWQEITGEQRDQIEKVRDLIKAVEGEVEPFDTYEMLTSRMMMASTVGEAMAIVNALVGEEVFNVKPSVLQLENV